MRRLPAETAEIVDGLATQPGPALERLAALGDAATLTWVVPRVSTHSLRGLWATLAVGAGAASHAVAAVLGHHRFEVTQRHYAQPSAVSNAQTARVSTLLDMAPSAPENGAVQHLLAQLPPQLRAQVAAHLHTGRQDCNTAPESLRNPSSPLTQCPLSTER
ncbi:MAG: hypothetical protein U1A78_37775 [Polyangia bacterium]